MRSRQTIAAALIVSGVLVRLALAPWWAHQGDLEWFMRWGEYMREHGWVNIYQMPDANYPPLGMAVIAFAQWGNRLLGSGLSGEATVRLWRVLVKLPVIAADAGIAATIWHITKARRGALWLLAGVVFNPALIYLTAVWGQIDSLYALGALLAVWLSLRGRPFWSGVALGLGALFKPQALVDAPIVGLVTLVGVIDAIQARRAAAPGARIRTTDFHPAAKLAVGFGLTVLLGLSPLVLAGQIPAFVERLTGWPEHMSGWLTINAHDLWYLVTAGSGNWYGERHNYEMILPGVTYKTFGTMLMAAWTALICGLGWRIRRERLSWLVAAALLYLGVFYFSTGVTERYMYGAIPLLGAAAACALPDGKRRAKKALLVLLTAASVLHTLNLMWAAPALPFLEGWFADNRTAGTAIAAGLGLCLLAGLGLLARRALVMRRSALRPACSYALRYEADDGAAPTAGIGEAGQR